MTLNLTDDEAIDLIEGYDDWRRERSTKDPDLSPRAYLADAGAVRMQTKHENLVRAAGSALVRLQGVLDDYEYPLGREDLEAAAADLRGAL